MLWLRRSVACTGSIPFQCVWLTKWHWDSLVTEYFGFVLSVSFHKCSVRIFNCMLLLSERQTGLEKHQKKNGLSAIGEHWIEKDSLVLRWKMGNFGGVKLT